MTPNLDRLERMATFLEGLQLAEGQEFNLGYWLDPKREVVTLRPEEPRYKWLGPFSPIAPAVHAVRECGTVGCAMGWACHFGAFKDDGLKSAPGGVPYFDGLTNFEAIQKFFGIRRQTAFRFFMEDAYPEQPTRFEVAGRIRGFVKKQRAKKRLPPSITQSLVKQPLVVA